MHLKTLVYGPRSLMRDIYNLPRMKTDIFVTEKDKKVIYIQKMLNEYR